MRDSQSEYISSEIAYQGSYVFTGKNGHVLKVGKPILDTPHERQIWLSVSNLCRPGLLRERGRNTSSASSRARTAPTRGHWVTPPTGCCGRCPPTHTRCSISSTPRPGDSLLRHAATPIRRHSRPSGTLLRESIAPPRVTAALYRAAALIPGVTLVRQATDAIGRHGVAVARADRSGARYKWIFDAAAFRVIGERKVTVKNGKVTATTAILDRAFVDHAGQVPGSK